MGSMAVTGEAAEHVRIGLSGDVMLGRGLDQIQRHPGDPAIHESWATSAVRYVELAEAVSGPIPRAVDPAYVWGDLLTDLPTVGLDALIVNLETAVTDRGRDAMLAPLEPENPFTASKSALNAAKSSVESAEREKAGMASAAAGSSSTALA